MIKKILIANRGEIAVRIIRTCNKLNIKTVAVYSEADQKSSFVKIADESYPLGPSQVSESYLNMDKIISIAKEANVDAIHPGYGFLSENSTFAKLCEESGIIFIGPNSYIIEQMGDKITSRQIMERANVPVIAGTVDAVSSVEKAIEAANNIGYPVMLKASAGGGGIGIEIAHNEGELERAFVKNSKRALQLFGNESLFIEKLLINARHIEIQILADNQGNIIHLFDRECSIQRRNQKVIEEAPSYFISDSTRRKMGDASIQAAKEIGYTNAGTIEFLVDEEENFYFLEMNTRIQVEHPVTEEITGIDIVEAQILIAEGKALPIKQKSVKISGHAIEARIYAEDPLSFLPSPGKITEYKLPAGDHIRNETSVTCNTSVTPFYDPMIGKLIVKGKTREEAITRLKKALEAYRIKGIKTNIPMLLEVVGHEEFMKGNTTTQFLNRYYLGNFKK